LRRAYRRLQLVVGVVFQAAGNGVSLKREAERSITTPLAEVRMTVIACRT
jgi:hypothetical protein